MASSSRSEADAMIEEFIRLQEAQVRIQEAQLTVLKRMVGSSPAAGSTPSKDAEGDPDKETLPVTGDSMQSGQDGMAMEEAGEIIEEVSEAKNIKKDPLKGMHFRQFLAKKKKDPLKGINLRRFLAKRKNLDPLKGMLLREVSDQDPPEWRFALSWGHCKSLMTQLREDASLMMLTVDGRTVPHVASIYGCTPLVHQVLEKCKRNLDDRAPYYSRTPTGVEAVYFAVDERTQLTACDINRFFVGQKYSTPSPADGFNNCHNGQLVELIRDDINQLLLDETNHEVSDLFRADRIHNFDPEHIEFTFHHACSKLRDGEQCCLQYVETIIGCLMKGGGEKLNCLLQLQDGRGNPPFQHEDVVWMMSDAQVPGIVDRRISCMISTFKDLLQSSPNSFGIFINASDVRGWTFLHNCAARDIMRLWKRS